MAEKGVPRMAPAAPDSLELVARVLQRQPHPGTRPAWTYNFEPCTGYTLASQTCCMAYV